MSRNSYNLFDPAPLAGEPLSVATYLELVNVALGSQKAKITGEVSQVQIASSGHVYFSLKDQKENAVLSCVIWRSNYGLSGIALEVGMAVAVTGAPGIYAPTGRFSFKADTLELVGEGALKKEYDKLKRKLTDEGAFDEGRKRPLVEYPHRIGVITSKHGAVIHDFLNNLGRFGYSIVMVDSRVEGAQSVADLRAAFKTMRKQKLDMLVVIRGGGSLESLIGFNNEALVREVLDFPVPVYAGIGHDQDVPLLALAADAMGSTPTAIAHLINKSWEQANLILTKHERAVFSQYQSSLHGQKLFLANAASELTDNLARLTAYYRKVESAVRVSLAGLNTLLSQTRSAIRAKEEQVVGGFRAMHAQASAYTARTFARDIAPRMSEILAGSATNLAHLDKLIAFNDPKRQLALGYAIARTDKGIIRNAADVAVGDDIELLLGKGTIGATVKTNSK